MRGLNIAGMAVTSSSARAQTNEVTFTKDIAPILEKEESQG